MAPRHAVDPCSLNPRSLALLAVIQIALDVRRAQQLVDALGFGKAIVDAKTDIGCKLQVDAVGDLGPQIFLMSFEGGHNLFGIAAAHRHDIYCGQSQVGGDPHFRNCDHVSFDYRIMHFAANKHVSERMPNQFADAQLALRAAAWTAIAMMLFLPCHKFELSFLCPALCRASTSSFSEGSQSWMARTS